MQLIESVFKLIKQFEELQNIVKITTNRESKFDVQQKKLTKKNNLRIKTFIDVVAKSCCIQVEPFLLTSLKLH